MVWAPWMSGGLAPVGLGTLDAKGGGPWGLGFIDVRRVGDAPRVGFLGCQVGQLLGVGPL